MHLDIYYVHIHNKGNVRKKKGPRKNQNTCANVYIHT
jgi:hypothetical protein